MDHRIRQGLRLLLRMFVFMLAGHGAGFMYGELMHRFATQRPFALVSLWSTYTAHLRELSQITATFPGTARLFVPEMWAAYSRSVGLYVGAAVIAMLLGIQTGRWAVQRQHTLAWIEALASVATAVPALFFASGSIAVLYFFLIYTPWTLPLPLQGFGWDSHIVLPLCALSMRAWFGIAQATMLTLNDEYHKPHIMAVRARGFTEAYIMRVHVWPAQHSNTMLACIAHLQIMIAELVIVEYLFRWQGIGHLFTSAVVAPLLSNTAPSPFYADSGIIACCMAGFVSFTFVGELWRIATMPMHERHPMHEVSL